MSVPTRLQSLLTALADGREHTAEELLRTPGLKGVSRENLRLYIHRARAQGHFIVLLPGTPHAYQQFLVAPAAVPAAEAETSALDRELQTMIEPTPSRTKRDLALNAGLPAAALDTST